MDEKKNVKLDIDFKKIFCTLKKRRMLFLKVWVVTFILSCVWILPQPRFYTAEVSVAPESADSKGAGGLASLASDFGLNLGGGSADAIYPQLYPDVMASTRFLVEVFDIKIKTLDGEVETDYYSYLKSHQKENLLLLPFKKLRNWVKSFFEEKDFAPEGEGSARFNPFFLSRHTESLIKQVQENIVCTYSRTTDVVTITVTDQDPLVCALLADSVKGRLQGFITEYRTKKARVDYEHYKQLAMEARADYEKARDAYAAYADAHKGTQTEKVRTQMTDLENEMSMRYNVYSAMTTREQAAMAELQARTPVFTTLTNATVPHKPAGPKRMIFVAAMLFLATVGTVMYLFRRELKEWF